jgi:four helix bundle protein
VPTQADQLRARVKRFAIRVLNFVKTLPRDLATDGVARQLARSAPSVSANYHSAGRARSRAEFIARLGIVADEAAETEGWLEVLRETGCSSGPEFDRLLGESRELRAIFVQAVTTARLNQKRTRSRRSHEQ